MAVRKPNNPTEPSPVLVGIGVLLVFASVTRLWRIGPFHPADLVLIGWTAVWFVQWLTRQCSFPRPIGAPLGWAVAALAGLALIGSAEVKPALLEVAKVAALLVIATLLFANIAYTREKTLRVAIAAATGMLVIVAVFQLLHNADPVKVSGLLDNRTLYGACVAAGAPFVICESARMKQGLRQVNIFNFTVAATMTLLSLPMLIIFALGALLVAHCARMVWPVVCGLALGAMLIFHHVPPRDQVAQLADSVSIFDSNGHVRRHAIEGYSSVRAIADRPLLGHGPAMYQSVAGSAQYRAELPAPAENRVELGTNPGYLVMAVEYGIPAAACFALMLLAAGIAALATRNGTGGQATSGPPIGGHAASNTKLGEGATEDLAAVAAGVAALTLAASFIFTVLLINGPGFLLAAIVGICAAQRQRSRDAARTLAGGFALAQTTDFESGLARLTRKEWRAWLARTAGVCACIAAGLIFRSPHAGNADDSYENMAASDFGQSRAVVVLHAADATAVVPPMHKAERRDAAGGRCLAIDEGAGKPPKVEGSAEIPVKIAQHGAYRVWVRAWWSDGCANSVAAALDGGKAYLIGQDGNYARWHWVRGPVVELEPGKHVLTLYEREDNLWLDQLALCNDDTFIPSGVIEAAKPAAPAEPRVIALAEPAGSAKTGSSVTDTAPPATLEPANAPVVENSPAPQPKRPLPPTELPKSGPAFVVGIAGSYRSGFEGHLVSLGIPYVRLREDQLGKIEELKDISVLISSDAQCGSSAAYEATLSAFLKSGRTAIVEFPPENFNKSDDTENLFLFPDGNRQLPNSTLIADASPFFKGLPALTPYPPDVTCNCIPLNPGIPGVSIFGGQSTNRSNRAECGALMVRTVGKGKLYFLGVSAAFSSMWRTQKIDPFLVNVLRDAVGPNCLTPFADFEYAPKQTAAVNVTDDFMRSPGQKGGWKVQSGTFELTGESGDQHTAFTVRARGAASASIGAENWKDYRVAASVLLREGEAGVWQSIAGGSRLELRLRDHGRSVAIVRYPTPSPSPLTGSAKSTVELARGADESVLAEAAVPEYANGWRRLALFRRDGVTQGFVDGEPVLRVKDAPEPAGRCGLCANGDANFDDFAAIDTATLTPGRDVAPGEEGSERCMARYYQRCSEKLSIYSPLWMLQPWPSDQNFVHIALPLYSGGELAIDDRAPAPIAAGDDLPVVKLPALPHFDCAIHSTGWRDYHFNGQITDWRTTSGDWGQVKRWSCNPNYEWYGGRASQDAVIWHKHAAKGSVAMEVLMAPRADSQYGEEQGHDLNLVIYGNGKDLSDGYLFTVLSAGRGCVVSRNGRVLATAPNSGIEASGHTLHHSWFSVAASVSHGKIRFYFDRRLAIEYTDPQPLNAGSLGIWTRQNKISLARATVSYGE